ncbi:dde superfamily endonuclease [Holotrichia oblita]|uniref:Dde superfamily endonuclease n=1 Tax=Holotrichia oblita TaxID=644536 RepID=A0ACB9TQF9_HOLOL|nr:dde superfamily endonuclease [Holotrichia oblita]
MVFGTLLGKAWGKLATVENGMSGFRATGIAPFNPDAIPDHACITIQMEQDAEVTSHGSNSTVKNSSPPSPPPQLTINGSEATDTRISSPLPGCSHDPGTATLDIDPIPEKTRGNDVRSSWIPETNELQKSPMSFAASPNFFEITSQRYYCLVYDGHASHVDSRLIEAAQTENRIILKLPAHSSHLLQPLDVSVLRLLKLIWEKKLVVWQRRRHGCKIPKKHFSILLDETWNDLSRNNLK